MNLGQQLWKITTFGYLMCCLWLTVNLRYIFAKHPKVWISYSFFPFLVQAAFPSYVCPGPCDHIECFHAIRSGQTLTGGSVQVVSLLFNVRYARKVH